MNMLNVEKNGIKLLYFMSPIFDIEGIVEIPST